jgi:hypothetical protein
MAKRKTKKEEVIDLKPKAEKITEEQLEDTQKIINNINMSELEIGRIETRKHRVLHSIAVLNDKLTLMQSEFEKEYGTSDINIQTGEIKYPKNDETN